MTLRDTRAHLDPQGGRTEAPVVIVGAGTAGLSLAYHLALPYRLFEREDAVGGLCRSITLAGCTFDYAPKVLLLGDAYATELSERLLGDNVQFVAFRDYVYHVRHRVYTRVPIQKHLHGLPSNVIVRAVAGLLARDRQPERSPDSPPENYQAWLYDKVGRPLADEAILPQERKKWKIDPATMDYRWAPGRVPSPSVAEALRGAHDASAFGRRLGYTRRGGIGALMEAFADRLEHYQTGVGLEHLDLAGRTATFSDGSAQHYRALVSTLPLPSLVERLEPLPDDIRAAAEALEYLSLRCVCVVVKAEPYTDKQFVYVPDPDTVFHRVTYMSNLSPEMAPAGYVSLQVEVSYVGTPEQDDDTLTERVLADLYKIGFIRAGDPVVATQVLDIPFAYPRQSPDRAAHVERIRRYLADFDVYLCGRNAEWEYYNMHDVIPRSRDLAEQLQTRYPNERYFHD